MTQNIGLVPSLMFGFFTRVSASVFIVVVYVFFVSVFEFGEYFVVCCFVVRLYSARCPFSFPELTSTNLRLY